MDAPVFDEAQVLQELRHYLPSQAPLKDIGLVQVPCLTFPRHYLPLHVPGKSAELDPHNKFHEALRHASAVFGYQVYLPLDEYRAMYGQGQISEKVAQRTVAQRKGEAHAGEWLHKMLHQTYDTTLHQRVGQLRQYWKHLYKINLEKEVHPLLFRMVGAYLDQGIAMQKFPISRHGFLASLRQLERNNFTTMFRGKLARRLLLYTHCDLVDLLKIVVGDERYYARYLFDQQFAHPGWSGMVNMLEERPDTLFDKRAISLRDFIAFELLIEIDVLEVKGKGKWRPFSERVPLPPDEVLAPAPYSEFFEVCALWQEAMEWSYYDQVLKGLQLTNVNGKHATAGASFQALFCIDDRECSIRRHLEQVAPQCQTFGTAGFFNVEFFFQPKDGKFVTKSCPAPVQPKYVIREREAAKRHRKDAHLSKRSHGFFDGLLAAPTMGLLAAAKLALSIFRPMETPTMVSSFNHMDPKGKLDILHHHHEGEHEGEQQLGFDVPEMADRVEGLLRSIGLVDNFASLVYIVGHGASSVNNTYYAGYDCGACSGRAGSVNARVAALMANRADVRALLAQRGIHIPEGTRFVGGLHDTTRDLIEFFDEAELPPALQTLHAQHKHAFAQALDLNAKERSRRFLMINSRQEASRVHELVQRRAMSLFEPRPEWSHSGNALCVVGRRASNKHLFLDRRAFLNSYDYALDPDGKYLLGILRAVAPVCGGINLEYYFSRVDNERLGAGSKLPHNVVGLIGVANGLEGDLRTGLPRQMLNIHQPLRLMVIVEHAPEVVLATIKQHAPTYEWFANEWVRLAVVHPQTKQVYCFQNEHFVPYSPLLAQLETKTDLLPMFETTHENLPVYLIQ